MRRWRRIGLIVFLALAIVLAVLIVGSRRGSRPSESIAFLHGMEGQRTSSLIVNPISRSISGPATYLKLDAEVFYLDQPFETVDKVAHKELVPRSIHHASLLARKDFPFSLYQINDPKTGRTTTVTIQKRFKGKTVVSVQELKQATWIDRALDWVSHVGRPEQK